MAYGTASLTSASPAKDLMAALNPVITGAGFSQVDSYFTPVAAVWTSVAYANGLYVMVGQSTSTASTSVDGITWTPRVLPANLFWQGVAYGNGLFVAVPTSSATYATSPDGITWTSRTLPITGAWSNIAYGGGLFVTMAGTTALTSPDGITWTQRTLPYSGAWRGIAYANGTWVAVSSTSAVAVSSPDGITWTQRVLPANTGWSSVAYGNGVFVAATSSTATFCATSPDGITWTSRTMGGTSVSIQALAYGAGLFVMLPASGLTYYTSPDGITWTARTYPNSVNNLSVVYGGSQFVAVTSSTLLFTSPDGLTFTARPGSGSSQSATTDVYKSPGSSNSFGSDWYLILKRLGDTGTALYYQVAETYDAVLHRPGNFGGTNAVAIPAATTYANPAAGTSVDVSFASAANLTLTTTVFSYWYSITKDRLIFGVKTSSETGFYAGLYDDLLPAGVTQFPLVAAAFPTTISNATYAIGGGGSLTSGGFTREPLQTASTGLNFEARIHSNYWIAPSTSGLNNIGFSPMTSTAALYGNTNSLSRVPIGSARVSTYTQDALRGLLIGCLESVVSSIAGDTITAGGKTYVRVCGPVTTLGYFVDTAL